MRSCGPKLLAEGGFEAVQLAPPDGAAAALKISDGGDRARPTIFAAALARCGVDSSALEPFTTPALPVTGQLVDHPRAA
ncbi:MAG TPA: asparaginase [Amycolatopsis sp.]|nr:asparaginase [Amycolatopsis sp.]